MGNGNVKWTHLLTIAGLVAGILYFIGSNVIANYDKLQTQDLRIEQKFDMALIKTTDKLYSIDKNVGQLETKFDSMAYLLEKIDRKIR